ncbi:DUF559 domain-containing protein [Amycolatopsis pithecellobii]|uniref:DUF559 domain-containing protein n=1 Tax=Amycolatopsis pithecellobii TaxID=664692 RepID=A0A6N7YX89_9PSEU|nr:DUF559 domain-containing protein [Amycolatopsis pithecellobii]MTD57707.1 DUF559 domain-containing protein [Amycolatopsis pithecellobii]
MVALPEGLHGAYTRTEIRRVLSPHALRVALANRRLTVFSKDIVIDSKRLAEFHTRAAAALLFAGPHAVLSGESALALHGCSAARTAPIHVTLPYFRRGRDHTGVLIHHGSVDAQDITELHGLRVHALDMALAQVLCRADRRTAIACADQALALLPAIERAECRAWTEERIRNRRDPRGRQQGLALLDLATGLAESPMESSILLAIVDAGLPAPIPQYVITDLDGRDVYRLDFAWHELRIGGEYDGYEAHKNRKTRDAARDEDLRRRGWLIIRADVDDLKDPSRLIADIRAAFRHRGLPA